MKKRIVNLLLFLMADFRFFWMTKWNLFFRY